MEQVMVEKLIDTAIEQLKFSYTPYSNFKVGAALLAKNVFVIFRQSALSVAKMEN